MIHHHNLDIYILEMYGTRLDIAIEEVRWRTQKRSVPVLKVTDNGYGMSHTDIVRMLSFGHDCPVEDDINQIGRFGVGFKVINIFSSLFIQYYNSKFCLCPLIDLSFDSTWELVGFAYNTFHVW